MGRVRLSTVEVEITSGIGIHVVGLADVCVKEMLLRVVTAIGSLGFTLPGKKVVINFSPVNLYKKSSNFDVAVAVAVLVASGQVAVKEGLLERCMICGKLGLDGTIREGDQYRGYETASLTSQLIGERPLCLLTGKETAIQASVYPFISTYSFGNLANLLEVLSGKAEGVGHLVWNSPEYKEVENGIEEMRSASPL